jgi:hypothetical protein
MIRGPKPIAGFKAYPIVFVPTPTILSKVPILKTKKESVWLDSLFSCLGNGFLLGKCYNTVIQLSTPL